MSHRVITFITLRVITFIITYHEVEPDVLGDREKPGRFVVGTVFPGLEDCRDGVWDLPGSPLVNNLIPVRGTKILQVKGQLLSFSIEKIPCAATKTQHDQKEINNFFRKMKWGMGCARG